MRNKKINGTWIGLLLAGLIAVISGFLVPAGEDEHGYQWTYFNGFFALLGLVGCLAIIYLARWLGRYWLQRREDYYD